MKPFIINAHLGEDENELLLFVPTSTLTFYPGREQGLAHDLMEKEYEVADYKPCSCFFGKEADGDGGYAFTIIEQGYGFGKDLLKDVYQIIENKTTL